MQVYAWVHSQRDINICDTERSRGKAVQICGKCYHQREKVFLNDTDLTVNWNNMQSEIIFRNTYFYLYLQQQLNCQVTR